MNKRTPLTCQPLPSQFRQDGFEFHLCERVDDVALFRKSKHGRDTYEVVIIRRLPAGVVFAKEYPAREAMPSSETWGVQGWSLSTLERAREKFAEVARQECPFSPKRTAAEAFLGGVGVLIADAVGKPVLAGTSMQTLCSGGVSQPNEKETNSGKRLYDS